MGTKGAVGTEKLSKMYRIKIMNKFSTMDYYRLQATSAAEPKQGEQMFYCKLSLNLLQLR